MNDFIIQYRDPLLGIIVFIGIIFIIAFFSYFWGLFKFKDNKEDLKNFLAKFNDNLNENNLDILVKSNTIPLKSLLVLASSFNANGEYSKSIEIYISLIKRLNSIKDKKSVLFLLGKTYFKLGLLQRAEESFLKILKITPSDIPSLRYLSIVYEYLQEYKNALEVINSLEELGQDIKKDYVYLEFLNLKNDYVLNNNKKSKYLISLYKENYILYRALFGFLFKYEPKLAWANIDLSKYEEIIDILWNLDIKDIDFNVVEKDSFLKELYSAKNYISSSKYSKFLELDILINLKKSNYDKASLQFQYLCINCKKVFAFDFLRCTECLSIDSLKCEMFITKANIEKNISLQ